MGGMMGGRGMSGGGMMGGGRMGAVSQAMAHSAMSMMGGGGMMGGGRMSSAGSQPQASTSSAPATSQPTVSPQSPPKMMGGMMGGNATAQLFANTQVASVSSGMGIAGMMGGMMGGMMSGASNPNRVMNFDYGDKFNRQDIKQMREQGFDKKQINRFIDKKGLGDTRAGGRFQENLANRKAKKSTAYTDLLGKFNTLQTQFDELQNSQGQGSADNSIDYGDTYNTYQQYEPKSEQLEEEKTTSLNTESALPFGGYSSTSINVGGGYSGYGGYGGYGGFMGYPTGSTNTGPRPEIGNTDTPAVMPPSDQPSFLDQVQSDVKPATTTSTTPEPGSGTGPTGFTGYQPFTLQNYTPLKTPVAQNQQIYTSQGGQGFYGAPQVTPTNPFTGAAYELDENGLPQYNHTYGLGTTLPGQVLPTKQGQSSKKKPTGNALGGL